MVLHARSPVRFDLAGGWTDVAWACQHVPGRVVNVALSLYAYATVASLEGKGEGIEVVSPDHIRVWNSDEEGDTSNLLVAAAKHFKCDGIELSVRVDVPQGSGLGTSGALGVAVVGAFEEYVGHSPSREMIAERACFIEQHEMGILAGKQDQYVSAFGGFQSQTFKGEHVNPLGLYVPKRVILGLEKRLVLCYTGQFRLSGKIHAEVQKAFQEGNLETMDALIGLRAVGKRMAYALCNEDWKAFGESLAFNWTAQKRLHSAITNDQIEALFNAASDAGAISGKLGGAGGGGCALFFCEEGRESAVRQVLRKAGAEIIPFVFDREGLVTWRA